MRSVLLLAVAPFLAQAANCSRTSTGFTPLNGPYFRPYQGFAGGLYPNGRNLRPAAQETAGIAQMAQVQPRNSAGAVDSANGRIVLLSVGMSNATQEFSAFKELADRDPQKNAKLVIVDGAQGSWSADRIVANPDPYWTTVDQRLAAAGVLGPQVQAAWLKEADAMPTSKFPDDAKELQSELRTIAQMLRTRYPNLKLLYLSSRTYAGYATTNLNPEPYAYESGFAVKWLIEQQISGDAAVAGLPWMAWGPYLWTDGTQARADGLVWECSDTAADGTHPSASGQQKVARMLLDLFKSDTTARPWFVSGTAQATQPTVTRAVNAASYDTSLATGSVTTLFGSGLASREASANDLPLPYGIEGTTVIIGGQPAPLYYVSPGQINAIVPPQVYDSSIIVQHDGIASPAYVSNIGFMLAEGLFSTSGAGQGPAAARHADGRLVTTDAPVRSGESIAIWATGHGVRNPMILIPDVVPLLVVGGTQATIDYYGPAPGLPGLEQIDFRIPADAPTGPAVPVQLHAGSFSSNTVTLPIAQ